LLDGKAKHRVGYLVQEAGLFEFVQAFAQVHKLAEPGDFLFFFLRREKIGALL
jgi:hypothetical protein